jgi:Fe2+ or Zn2+ uptake regulation protein
MEDANHKQRRVVLQKGKRHTKARREIFAVLEKTKSPLSIKDVVEHVSANEASVYRTIRMLESDGLVSSIRYPDGLVRYELSDHHHHIICVACGYTEHLACHAIGGITQAKSLRFPEMLSHEITYYGRCVACVR